MEVSASLDSVFKRIGADFRLKLLADAVGLTEILCRVDSDLL